MNLTSGSFWPRTALILMLVNFNMICVVTVVFYRGRTWTMSCLVSSVTVNGAIFSNVTKTLRKQ